MTAFDFLLTFFFLNAFCDSIQSHDPTSSWRGEGRLDQMEKVLSDLQSKVSSQETLNRRLQNRVTAQDAVINDLESKVSWQGKLNRHLESKVFSQEKLNRHLESKVSSQDEMILLLQAKESQQDALLVRQSRLLREFQSHVSSLEEMLKQRDVKEKQQPAINPYLNFINSKKLDQMRFFHHAKPLASFTAAGVLNLELGNNHHLPRPKPSVTSAGHDISARSDDAGPLQAVVNNLEQAVTKLGADFQALSSQIQSLQYDVVDARTATFIHWGSNQCPSSHAQLVYSGVVGGKYYNQAGSGSNLLCLTLSPIAGNDTAPGTLLSYIYGAEYETHDTAQNKDPVCAVCRSSFSNVIMIPGTTSCTSGWTPLYSGYLMAEYYKNPAASQFVCVDSAMQSRQGSQDNHDGAVLHFTAAKCGSLPCGPYVNNKVFTCVVCGR